MGTTVELDDILEHYGIKGMKWGVRRTDAQLARARGKKFKETPKNMQSKDAKKAKSVKEKVKTQGIDALSNDELQELTRRINLESNYNRLSEPTKKKGKSKVKQIQKAAATVQAAKTFAKSPAGQAIAAAITASVVTDFSDLKL